MMSLQIQLRISPDKRCRQLLTMLACWAMLVLVAAIAAPPSQAQQPALPAGGQTEPIVDADELRGLGDETVAEPQIADPTPSGVDLLSLVVRGGAFMIPIGLMSFLVVTLAVERLLTMRRRRMLPRRLERELRALADPIDEFDPPQAWRTCQAFPSPTSRVVEAMLQRTGQSLGEIERTANETAQREADSLAGPIRWLNLAAAATPLMGLLGTVWGMIMAFHESTTLTADRSRSEQLSEGIYTALVTTLAGLAVAIPAAILAQYLENRVSKLFHRIEKLAFDLAPGLARFSGRMRMGTDGQLRPLGVHDSRDEDASQRMDGTANSTHGVTGKNRDQVKAG